MIYYQTTRWLLDSRPEFGLYMRNEACAYLHGHAQKPLDCVVTRTVDQPVPIKTSM